MSTRRTAAQIAACSRGLLHHELTGPASLVISRCGDAGETRGAWSSASGHARGGGGGAISVGPESVYVALILEHAAAVAPDADPERIVNRHVRPLLAALGKLGVPSMYGGRDFIASRKSPIAWASFQHSADTGRAAFEAIIGVETPIASEPRRAFRDRAPKTLQALGCVHDAATVAERIEQSYRTAYPSMSVVEVDVDVQVEVEVEVDVEVEVEVEVEVQVEVGVVGARRVACVSGHGHGHVVYGDFYASREVVPRIQAGLAAGLEIDACLAAALSGAVLFGLPSTEPLSRVLSDVRRR